MLAACPLGITVCSLLILNVSEPAIHHLLEVPLALTGWSEEVIGTVAFIIALVLVSFLHVVFGEMVPKNISFSLPDRAALILAPPLVAMVTWLTSRSDIMGKHVNPPILKGIGWFTAAAMSIAVVAMFVL